MEKCCKNRFSPIGVIDSGIGGITVLSKIMESLPQESFIYLADKSGAPYGDKSAEYILSRTIQNCEILLGKGVKAIVVACNTATNVGIAELRKESGILSNCIYVGVEPAIKPAVESKTAGNILVLLTPATSKQKKFQELVKAMQSQNIIISPEPSLAMLVEENIACLDKIKNDVEGILKRHRNVTAVVLGCTHYIYLKDMISNFYDGKVKVFDGNQGTAKRLCALLREENLLNEGANSFVEFIIR